MSIRDRLIAALKKHFVEDKRRIAHALNVLKYAETILDREQGDPDVVVASAVLHDCGIKEAERKYGSSASRYQEIEGPGIARNIMVNLNMDRRVADEVCEIIAHHHTPGAVDTLNFRILWDADLIANMIEEKVCLKKEKIDRLFMTVTGKIKAEQELSIEEEK